MANQPDTTLFMLISVDGKISTGDVDDLDVDKDFSRIAGIKEGLPQYYNLEQQTSLFSLNSGRVQAKMGVNEIVGDVKKLPVSFIIIDNQPHLDSNGVDYFIKRSKKLYLVTTNKDHPAFNRKDADNLEIIFYNNKIDFVDLFKRFKEIYQIKDLTIQTGGTLNAELLRSGLINHISVVVAPALVGGKNTSTLIDGESLHSEQELLNIKALELVKCDVLENSYLHLRYDVINETEVDKTL